MTEQGETGRTDSNQQGSNTAETERGYATLANFLKSHPIDGALWITRMLTILFTFAYIIPIFGDPSTIYYKALAANAATSALRLHQRMPSFQLSREFLARVFLEDSAHYLMFSLIFLYVSPMAAVLAPVSLFAVLHFASTSLNWLDMIGRNSWWGARFFIGIVEVESVNILNMVACCEIFLMPFCVIMLFLGRTSLLTIFLYYRFLTLRYSSRRNPYTRNNFTKFRLAFEQLASTPRCPTLVRNGIYRIIGVVSRLAPPTVAAQ